MNTLQLNDTARADNPARTDDAAPADNPTLADNPAPANDAAREQIARVEGLLERLESLPDPAARQTATEVVQALLDLYGEGLGRIVDVVAACDDGTLAAELGEDELVSHLLLLHGLHPVPVEERVHGALEGVLPYLQSHGGSVELLGVEDAIVHLRLEGSCSGCPSSAMTLKLAIEEAIFKAAPDVEEVRAEGAVAPPEEKSQLLQIQCPSPLRSPTAA
jgi:Fe-S cluster biogenesis protein NfuA